MFFCEADAVFAGYLSVVVFYLPVEFVQVMVRFDAAVDYAVSDVAEVWDVLLF